MTSRQAMEEWNNGTIFRVHVTCKPDLNGNVDVPVDVAQEALNGKVFVGVENIVMKKEIPDWRSAIPDPGDPDEDPPNYNLAYWWEGINMIQFGSPFLPPDIDFSTTSDDYENITESRPQNRQIFARFALDNNLVYNLAANQMVVPQCFSYNGSLNKDSLMYEMSNNPNALRNGRLRFTIYDQLYRPLKAIPSASTTPVIEQLSFTLVIYKPRNTYN